MYRKIIISFLIVFSLTQSVFWAWNDEKYITAYNNFYSKIDVKYWKEKKIQLLKDFEKELNVQLWNSKLTAKQKEYFQALYALNHQKIIEIEWESKKSPIVVQKQKELSFFYSLKKMADGNISFPSHIQKLQKLGKKVYIVNNMNEFVDDNKVKKFVFAQFYPVKESYVETLSSKNGVILKNDSWYMFVEDYTIVQKIPFSSLFWTSYSSRFITYNKRYVLETDTYYSFIFDKYNILDDTYWFYLEDYGLSSSKVIFFQDDQKRFWFLSDYSKIKLISSNILEWISNKEEFLKNVNDDKKFIVDESDEIFKQIKKLTLSITSQSKNEQDKIQKIYSWILHNITYTKNFTLDDYKIYSWILTYKNKDGVCDGYTKLMGYMLLFAGVSDVEILKWFVIDVPDFPQIWHAWVKIGDYYYDPTFDDPVWAVDTLTSEKYKYYKLPKDLFYTNRYDFEELPEYLTSYTLNDRKKEVKKALSKLTKKYKDQKYLLLAPLEFRSTSGLAYDSKITFESLKKLIPYYEMQSDYSITINGKKKYISFFQYYNLANEDDIENVLSMRNFDMKGLYLFKWIWSSWNIQYRLGYDVTFE